MPKKATLYDFRTKDGALAGSIWADDVHTRGYIPEDPYCKTFGTFFYLDGALAGEVWSDCLDWQMVR